MIDAVNHSPHSPLASLLYRVQRLFQVWAATLHQLIEPLPLSVSSSTVNHYRFQTPPQCHKRTSVSTAFGGKFGSTCTGYLYCSTSPFYHKYEHLSICMFLFSQYQICGWSAGWSEGLWELTIQSNEHRVKRKMERTLPCRVPVMQTAIPDTQLWSFTYWGLLMR